MITLVIALVSALAYGVSDFYGGIASRTVNPIRVVLVSYPVAVVLMALLVPFFDGDLTWRTTILGVLAGIMQGLAVWWFYAALASGPMSIISPLTAVIVAGLPLIIGMALGERPSVVAWVGMVVAIGAVLLVSKQSPEVDEAEIEAHRAPPHRFTTRVALLTIGSGVTFAVQFALLHEIDTDHSGIWPVLLGRISATAVAVVVAVTSTNLVLPRGKPLYLGFLLAVLDTVANVTMFLALGGGMLSLVSVVIALYPAATVGLAMTVLGERVGRLQKFGMALAVFAVSMIAAGA